MPNFDIPWNTSQITTLQACSYATSALSVLGSLAIIISHLHKKVGRLSGTTAYASTTGEEGGRNATHHVYDRFDALVFYLSISHGCNSILWLIALSLYNRVDRVCAGLQPFILYFYFASFFWTIFIATEIAYRKKIVRGER